MIILDTNVLSEPIRARPDDGVVRWLTTLDEDAALTSITVGEILSGVRMLPQGRRRTGLTAAVESILASFADRVFSYDANAARTFAELRETRRIEGHPLSTEDGMIAAICRTTGSKLATRNIEDFRGLGLELINPWHDG